MKDKKVCLECFAEPNDCECDEAPEPFPKVGHILKDKHGVEWEGVKSEYKDFKEGK